METKYQIVTLPTDKIKVGQLYKSGEDYRVADKLDVKTIKLFAKQGWPKNAWIPQEVYVLSTELPVKPIKDEYFLFWGSFGTDLFRYLSDAGYGISGKDVNAGVKMLYSTSKCSNRILASTDKRLKNVLSIPDSFIRDYKFTTREEQYFIGHKPKIIF